MPKQLFLSNVDPGDENAAQPQVFNLAHIAVGAALRITTRNSTYILRKQAGGLTWRIEQVAAKSGGYTLKPNPLVAEITQNYLSVGEILLFHRKSPNPDFDVRLTCTSTIQSIEEIK